MYVCVCGYIHVHMYKHTQTPPPPPPHTNTRDGGALGVVQMKIVAEDEEESEEDKGEAETQVEDLELQQRLEMIFKRPITPGSSTEVTCPAGSRDQITCPVGSYKDTLTSKAFGEKAESASSDGARSRASKDGARSRASKGFNQRASYLARQSATTSVARSSYRSRVESHRRISHCFQEGVAADYSLRLQSFPQKCAGVDTVEAPTDYMPQEAPEALKLARIIDATNVAHPLARAALNWSMGDVADAITNLLQDIDSIMKDNDVSRHEAVQALTAALMGQINTVMAVCHVPFPLACAALNWSNGDQQAAIDNLAIDIRELMRQEAIPFQAAVAFFNAALSDTDLDEVAAWYPSSSTSSSGKERGGGGGGRGRETEARTLEMIRAMARNLLFNCTGDAEMAARSVTLDIKQLVSRTGMSWEQATHSISEALSDLADIELMSRSRDKVGSQSVTERDPGAPSDTPSCSGQQGEGGGRKGGGFGLRTSLRQSFSQPTSFIGIPAESPGTDESNSTNYTSDFSSAN